MVREYSDLIERDEYTEGEDKNEKTILQGAFSVGRDGLCAPWEAGRVRRYPQTRF